MAPADGGAPQSATVPAPEASAAAAPQPRSVGTASTFSMQQVLVTIALSYQLLFSEHSAFTLEVLEFVVAGLLAVVLVVLVMPHHMWRTRLVIIFLILGNTVLCANVFYMAGLADPGLYVTLALLVPIAMFAPSANLHFALSLGLCVVYGIVWYVMVGQHGPVMQGDLLRFPVLLVMANFYWQILGLRVGGLFA
jgi:hypothetical protein